MLALRAPLSLWAKLALGVVARARGFRLLRSGGLGCAKCGRAMCADARESAGQIFAGWRIGLVAHTRRLRVDRPHDTDRHRLSSIAAVCARGIFLQSLRESCHVGVAGSSAE